MAIALPTALPPTLVEASALESMSAAPQALEAAGIRYVLRGGEVLPAARLQAAVAAAPNPSEVVRAVLALARESGYVAARVLYAPLDSSGVTMLLIPGKLSKVEAPEALAPFFAGLEGKDVLRDSDLEPRRVMASLHADRLGYQSQPELKLDGDNVVMDLKAQDTGTPGGLKLEIGNPGTRFTGRVLADMTVYRSDAWGNQYTAQVRDSEYLVRNLERGAYHEQSLGFSRVLPRVMLNAGLRHVKFKQQLSGDALNGQIVVGEVSAMSVPLASFSDRLSVQAKADWTRKVSDVQSTRQTVQREPYPSLEASTQYSRRSLVWDQPLEWDVSLAYRKGFGSEDDKLTLADLQYQLVRSAIAARLPVGDEYSINWQNALQWSNDTVPEQQQWVLGGMGNLHAWYPGALVGDSAWLSRLQLDRTATEWAQTRFAPVAFVEYAATQQSANDLTQQLADVGVGLNISGSRIWSASIAAALPILEDDGNMPTFHPARAGVFLRLAGVWN